MYTEFETCMYMHVKVCGERDRNGAVAVPEILQGRHLGSNLEGSVKLGGFSQSCICIASILFLLRFYRLCRGEGDENSARRLKASKALILGPLSHAS